MPVKNNSNDTDAFVPGGYDGWHELLVKQNSSSKAAKSAQNSGGFSVGLQPRATLSDRVWNVCEKDCGALVLLPCVGHVVSALRTRKGCVEHPGHISGLHEAPACGTWGRGLGAMMVVLGWWWDWMILKVSANLDDSGIWWFSDSVIHLAISGVLLAISQCLGAHWWFMGTGEALSHLVRSEFGCSQAAPSTVRTIMLWVGTIRRLGSLSWFKLRHETLG